LLFNQLHDYVLDRTRLSPAGYTITQEAVADGNRNSQLIATPISQSKCRQLITVMNWRIS